MSDDTHRATIKMGDKGVEIEYPTELIDELTDGTIASLVEKLGADVSARVTRLIRIGRVVEGIEQTLRQSAGHGKGIAFLGRPSSKLPDWERVSDELLGNLIGKILHDAEAD